MKTIKIPKFLHEVLGKESTLEEILMIFITSIFGTCALFYFTNAEWKQFPFWKTLILFLLIFDVLAGFIANLTLSTNNYYKENPKLRLVFIAIHIQPLIFSFLLNNYFYICFIVWAYTLITALSINALQKHPAQRVLAGCFVMIGLIGLLLYSNPLPNLLLIALAFFHLKVTYSFAVDHYAIR
ncbi:MAG: hypothetical protein KF758_07105 [Anaerolineales bacterium]|nr:hypothetical protein [Anaerolineales bacterium]MBX3036664.1 hypothetical protein [Anaerolineales bacterium]